MVRVSFLELMPRGPRRRWHRALRRAAPSSCYQSRRHRKRRSWDRCIPGAPWRRRRESIPVPLDENFERAADGMDYLPCSGQKSSDALLKVRVSCMPHSSRTQGGNAGLAPLPGCKSRQARQTARLLAGKWAVQPAWSKRDPCQVRQVIALGELGKPARKA